LKDGTPGGIRHERSEVSRSEVTATRPKNSSGAEQLKKGKKKKNSLQTCL